MIYALVPLNFQQYSWVTALITKHLVVGMDESVNFNSFITYT